MAVQAPMTPPPDVVGDDYDELLAADRRLKELHIQLRDLRATIPSMVRPLVTHFDSPMDLYRSFEQAAVSVTSQVTAFAQVMQDDQTKAVLARAAKSRKDQAEPVKPWRVSDHPDWLDLTVREKDEIETLVKEEEVKMEDELPDLEEQDVETVMRQFSERHPQIKVNRSDATNTIEVDVPAKMKMNFIIASPPDPSAGPIKYTVSTKGTMKLHAAIIKSIAARPRPHDLTFLLEMLAAYHDIGTRKCDKCGTLLDKTPQFPAVRRKLPSNSSQDRIEGTWQAFHSKCS